MPTGECRGDDRASRAGAEAAAKPSQRNFAAPSLIQIRTAVLAIGFMKAGGSAEELAGQADYAIHKNTGETTQIRYLKYHLLTL
jgi:hypothetical protein